jgi:GNAT superfamily N-acetyltransferase
MAAPRRRPSRRRRGSAPGPPARGPVPGFRLRRTNAADLRTLVAHRRRMWRELRDYSPRELDRHDVAYGRWVRREAAARTFLGFVVEDSAGRAVASGAVWLMPSQPRPGPLGRGRVPYILSMFTEPRARGRGLASWIVREMIRWARSHRYGRVVLHASRFGRPVYERLGFGAGSEMRIDLVEQAPLRRGPLLGRRPVRRSAGRSRGGHGGAR